MSIESSSSSASESSLFLESKEITIQDFKKGISKSSDGKKVSIKLPEDLTWNKMVKFLKNVEEARHAQEDGLGKLSIKHSLILSKLKGKQLRK